MPIINIDFDVFKALTARRSNESVTENDVLRQLLGLTHKSTNPEVATHEDGGRWVTKGVTFPPGSEFRANYKGQTYLGRVEDGALVLSGRRFDTPSSAAMSITGNPVNGWTFWECRLPGESSWRMIKSLRVK